MTKEEQLKQMYAGNLNSQKEQLKTDYENAVSNLDAQKQQNQQATDDNLNRTAVEAQRRALNDEEYYAAAGLTSGARAQARMARDNQLMSDLSTLRAAQQAADADAERQRGLLAREYDSAIRKAQADNDLALAQALYEQAALTEQTLLTQQKEAAKLMADVGDYTRMGELYRLTSEEIAALQSYNRTGNKGNLKKPTPVSKPEANTGNHNDTADGLLKDQTGSTMSTYESGGVTAATSDQVSAMQMVAGLPMTGQWDDATAKAVAILLGYNGKNTLTPQDALGLYQEYLNG